MGCMKRMFIFGLGYSAGVLATRLCGEGWIVAGTGRIAGKSAVAFDDVAAITKALSKATHILSSIPPDAEQGDPVLNLYREVIKAASAKWIGYLSSTGVYGDTGGAWADERAALAGRRAPRMAADLAWQRLREDACVFRLPGIYGPGRSALERLIEGKAHRIDLPDQIFSRVHVDDIARGIIASFDGPAGVYNLSDDLPAAQNQVIAYAAKLLGKEAPPILSLKEANLSPEAQSFYTENRRISNRKAKRLLGWSPIYPTYRQGLRAIWDEIGRKID